MGPLQRNWAPGAFAGGCSNAALTFMHERTSILGPGQFVEALHVTSLASYTLMCRSFRSKTCCAAWRRSKHLPSLFQRTNHHKLQHRGVAPVNTTVLFSSHWKWGVSGRKGWWVSWGGWASYGEEEEEEEIAVIKLKIIMQNLDWPGCQCNLLFCSALIITTVLHTLSLPTDQQRDTFFSILNELYFSLPVKSLRGLTITRIINPCWESC